MSLSTNQSILRGRFTSDGTSAFVNLPWLPNRFELVNITQFGSTAGATPVMTAEWRQGMSNGAVITGLKTNGAATIQIPTMNTTDGITLVNGNDLSPGPELTGTSITQANPAVVTINSHGLSQFDNIRIYNSTGMLQVAGVEFTVTNVLGANTFEIGFDTSGFAAAATALNARKIPLKRFFPEVYTLATMSQATQGVFSVTTNALDANVQAFTVGQVVSFRVPSAFGMVELDGLQGEIVSIAAATGLHTVDIDTSAFTAFSYPTSATAAAGVTFPQVVPVGKDGAPIVPDFPTTGDVLTNQSNFQVQMGTNAIGGANDVMEWIATRDLTL